MADYSHAAWIANHRDAWLDAAWKQVERDHGYPHPAPAADDGEAGR